MRAAVLIAHGFYDTGHDFQEDEMWRALPAELPKRQVQGPWGHEWPQPLGATPPSAWENELVRWLDHWLKGGPEPAGLNRVEYKDGAGRPHSSSSWPPDDARLEGLYLSRGGLTSQPGTEATTLRSIPTAIGPSPPPVCPDGHRQLYLTTPLAQETVVAGNPYLRLTVTSDRPAGMLGAYLYDVGPDFSCLGPVHRGAVRPLTVGTADLRYHAGTYEPVPFPVGSPTTVRIDLSNLAERTPAGHRIALTLAHPRDRYGGPEPAALTIAASPGEHSSQLVLTLVEGSLGASGPAAQPPPRPFGADWYQRR